MREIIEMEEFPWNHSRRYNDFATVFNQRFSTKVQKISVDAGFSCPNRDGSRGRVGCTYCNNETFNPGYTGQMQSITSQLEKGIRFFARKYPNMSFIAYFQSYSNTFAPPEMLKALYAEALGYPGIVGLAISTRPDCIDAEVLDLLEEFSARSYLMLELGIESHLNRTLQTINRGHTFEETISAFERAAARKIHSTGHVILGLPGENRADLLEQAKFISQLPVENLKIHQLQIHRGTIMAHQYQKNPADFNLPDVNAYVELVVDYLELLDPRITIERFVSQSPSGLLIAPAWGLKNYQITSKIEKRMAERDTWQGKLFRL